MSDLDAFIDAQQQADKFKLNIVGEEGPPLAGNSYTAVVVTYGQSPPAGHRAGMCSIAIASYLEDAEAWRFNVMLGRDNVSLAEAHELAAQYRATVSVVPYDATSQQCAVAQAILAAQRILMQRPQ